MRLPYTRLLSRAFRMLFVLASPVLLSTAQAAVLDAAGDFVSAYTGTKGGDLDVLSSDVLLNPGASTLTFTATLAGPVGTTPGAFYVWGVNRGQGTERLVSGTPSVGAGVFFDSVMILRPDTTGQVNDLITPANNRALAAGSAIINGSQISATVPLSFFPSTGLAATSYTWNLWPRLAGGNNQISDFAPDASNAGVTVTPEPASLSLLLGGAALLACRRRLR